LALILSFKKMFNPKWRFDFKITIDNHIVVLEPGKQISIPVRVQVLRGKPQPIALDVNTHWESVGLSTKIVFDELTPSTEWTATMMIRASINTPPDSYLFTVRGSVNGTFNTSEDAVTVIVEKKDKQRSNKQDNFEPKQANESVEASFDLGNMFSLKGGGQPEPIENKKSGNQTALWIGIGLFVGTIISVIIISNNGGGGGGGGGGFNCPTSCGSTGVGVIVSPQCKCPSAC
jgi:hypothetical protein